MSTDIEMLVNQLAGIDARKRELRNQEALFLKASGLEESAAAARAKIGEIETDIQAIKEELNELKARKKEALASTLEGLTGKMARILPHGEPVVEVGERFLLGWKINGTVRPYNGLSGGEKVAFDGALASALGAELIVFEAAELDPENLAGLVDKLSTDCQVIVNTCHQPAKAIPEGWMVVELK